VDHRHPQQRLDVDVVRLGLERVPEEDHQVDAPLGDRRPHLLVAAERSGEEAGDRQAELARDQPAGRAGGEELVVREGAAVVAGPVEHVVLAVVVGDQGDALARRHADAVDPHRLLGSPQDAPIPIAAPHRPHLLHPVTHRR
jgi:hypothetical protein